MGNENIRHLDVLITSPSTNSSEHIGGIATFTNLLIENNSAINYSHFVRGRKNNQKRGIAWFFRQSTLFFDFFSSLYKGKDIKVIHINMPLDKFAIVRDTILVIISSIFKRKIIIHLHGGKYNMDRSIPFYLKLIVKQSFNLSDRIIALGDSEKQFLCDYYKIKPAKVNALFNAVKIPENIEKKLYNSTVNLLYLGRIERIKGLKEIILALKLLKKEHDFRLIIAGEGPDKDGFIQDCKSQIPGKYEYVGVVYGKEKQMVFERSHIFLMPSYYEGLPYSLLEAMAYKLVPIVTPVGSVPELVEDGKNGFIVQVNDYLSLYKRIADLIEDPDMMKRMCSNAFNIISSRYSLTNHIKEINKIYFGLSGLNQ